MLTARPGQGSEKHISDMHIEELINLKKPSMEAMGIEEADMQAAHFDAMISPNLNDIQQGLAILSDRAALGHKDDKVAILCPGSGGREKCWHIDNYIATAGRLKKANYRPVFLLGAAEYERFDERQIDKLANAGAVIGGLSIEEVVGLLSAAAVYIGNDSGVSHISGTMHMPTVSVFGPTDPQMYKPPGTVSNAVKLSEEDFSRYSEKGVETVVAAAFDTIKNARTPMFEIHI
jgi:ADP-heptose:LPS heptosyltransferase